MRDDLAGQRRERLLVAEHAALDLDAVHELLDEHLLVVDERELDRRRELLFREHLGDADGGAETSGLHEDGEAERVLRSLAVPQRDVAGHRDPTVAHHGLEDVLVHRERRAEHACAHVRDARELEQALHRAVLTERPVQDREHHVHLAERRGHLVGRHRQRLRDGSVFTGSELPASVALDRHGGNVVPFGVEGLEHRPRGLERDLVLGRLAAEQDGDADALAHGIGGGGGVLGSRPTVRVTVEPFAAFVPPFGLCESTIPSSAGSVTS